MIDLQLAASEAHFKMSAGDKGCAKHLEAAKLAAREGAAGAKIGGRVNASGHCQEAPRALLAFDLHRTALFIASLLALLLACRFPHSAQHQHSSATRMHGLEVRNLAAYCTLPTVSTEPDLTRMDCHRCTGDPSTSASKSAPVTATMVSTWKRRDGPAGQSLLQPLDLSHYPLSSRATCTAWVKDPDQALGIP